MKHLLTIAALMLAQSAMAQFVDGNKLNDLLDSDRRMKGPDFLSKDPANASRFLGYLQGVTDVGLEYGTICPPPAFAGTQLIGVIDKYLRNYPENWNQSGAWLVATALRQSFPCKK